MHRTICSICCCAFLIIHFSAKSQESIIDYPVVSIRVNPFSFLESDAGVQVGIGYRWKKRWGATFDPMYIFYTPVRNWQINGPPPEKDLLRGIKIRSDIRYYFNDLYFGSGFRLLNPFIGPELHFKNVVSKKWDDFGINCIGQQCDYYMTTRYREIKKEIGIALKAGFTRPLSTRLSLEAYGGVGIRSIKVEERDIPLGGSFIILPVHDEIFGTPDGKPTTYIPMGFKLVYSFIYNKTGH